MHRLVIHKLGPIKDCSLNSAQFMAFTGYQASGKSTIAKAIFYFRTVKDDIYSLAQEKALSRLTYEPNKSNTSLKKLLTDYLREKFLRVFGSSWGMDNDMYMEYHYTEECYIKISLKENKLFSTPNYIWIDLSEDLCTFINTHDGILDANPLGVPEVQKQKYQAMQTLQKGCPRKT